MLFATTLLIAYFVYAAVGEKYLDCLTSNERFSLPEIELVITCTFADKLKRFQISQIYLLFNNRSWDYSTNLSYIVDQTTYDFHIQRESLTSEHTAWAPKEPWTVYSSVLHGTGKIPEFQGILLDHLTEPILQWSLGTKVNNMQLQDNSSLLLTQSTCALDVVITVPYVNPGSPVYLGVTKEAFANGNVQWFSMPDLCNGCQFLDLVLVNHYLLILIENKVFLSNYLLEKGKKENNELSFTEVFNIPNCMSVKKGQLFYTPLCRYHVDDDFEDDTIVLLYQCQTTSSEIVTNVYMSSSAKNFSKWIALGDSLTLPQSLSALAFNPQTHNLIMLYDLNSETIAEFHHFHKNLSVKASRVLHQFHQYKFPADSRVMGLFIHPISNFLYAYGKQVWLSTDDGRYFDPMPNPVESDTIKVCRSGYSDGSLACVTTNNKILYSKGSPARIWNVEPPSGGPASGIQLTVFFDYMENLYVCYVENGQVKSLKVDVMDGIKKGSLNFTNPLLAQVLPGKDIHFYEYPVNATASGHTSFSEFSQGMLLTNSAGGSVVIKDLQRMDDSQASRGFMVKLRTLVVEKLVQDKSTALGVTLSLETWDEKTYEGEVNLASGSWPADDVWKTIVVPYAASFLVKAVSGSRATVISMFNITSFSPAETGKWKMYDFRASSWSLKEDKCRHTLQSTLGDSNNYAVVDVDLRMNTTIEVSLGLSAPFEVGSDVFLYGYLSNPSVFHVNFFPYSSIAPLLEKLAVVIVPIVNNKKTTTLRVFAVGASMLCPKTQILITIYGACPSQRMLTFIYPENFSRENFLPSISLHKHSPVIRLKPNYRPPSHLGYGIPTSDNIYNANPKLPRIHEDFKISKETGSLKQCANARTRKECGCTNRMIMTDEARYSDCKMRAFMMAQPAVLETNFSMQVDGKTVEIPDNYLFRIYDVNNRSILVQYKEGASPSAFSKALRKDKKFAEMAKEHFEPNSIEIVMEGSGLYHLRAEIMHGLSFCPLYSEFQIYVTTAHLQYPIPYVINFSVALLLGGILFILALWYLSKHQYTTAIPATGSKCRDLDMKNTEPLHPPHSLLGSFSMGDRIRLSPGGEETSSTELLDSAKAQDLASVPHQKKHEHTA